MWIHSSVGRATHRQRGGHRFESRWSPDFFFQASSFQLLKLENLLRWSFFTLNFVLLQYLSAPQLSLFSHSNINDGDTRNIHSLYAVKACVPRPFHDRERQDRRLGTSQLQIGKTQRPKTCDGRSEERLIFDNVSLVKLKALTWLSRQRYDKIKATCFEINDKILYNV